MPPRRPCLGQGGKPCLSLAEPGKPRCTSCESSHQQQRNASRPQYRGDWPAISKAAIAAHRAEHGDVCPGWQVPPHQVDPSQWTTDHAIGPLCRSCNSRKGATIDRRAAAHRRTNQA